MAASPLAKSRLNRREKILAFDQKNSRYIYYKNAMLFIYRFFICTSFYAQYPSDGGDKLFNNISLVIDIWYPVAGYKDLNVFVFFLNVNRFDTCAKFIISRQYIFKWLRGEENRRWENFLFARQLVSEIDYFLIKIYGSTPKVVFSDFSVAITTTGNLLSISMVIV